MEKNKLISGMVILIIIVAGLSYWGFKSNVGKSTGNGPQVSGATTDLENQAYYDENAKVMEFFQDTCSWCIKEQPILQKLGEEGYRVKPMNIGSNHPDNQGMWKQYNVSGTPSFVAGNGDKLEGYQSYETLKAFLDNHK
jgi:thiol-disulfide isomerase/thioredoxin